MKKLAAFILFIGFIFIFAGCNSETFRQSSGGIINSHLERTVLNYHFEDGEFFSLSLYAFTENVSPIVAISLQTLFGRDDFDATQYEPMHNVYFHSFVKSLYTNTNHVNIELLTANSIQYDFYLAFKVGTILDDTTFTEQVMELYDRYRPERISFIDEIYYIINQDLSDGNMTRIDQDIISELTILATESSWDFDALSLLHALLNYVNHFDLQVNHRVLENLYDIFMDNQNQRFILSAHEVAVAQYMQSLAILTDLLGNTNLDTSFFYEYLQFSYYAYYPIFYEINSPRNFAFYLTLLYFTSESVSRQHHDNLLLIFDAILRDFYVSDQMALFYINYIAHKLDVRLDFVVEAPDISAHILEDVSMFYFYFKNWNIPVSEVNSEASEEIFIHLLYLDVLTDEEILKERLLRIDILSHKEHESFPDMLNRYVAISLDSGLMSLELENDIIEYINSRENVLGYSGRYSNFDFVTSTFYTNVLNMLNRGESNGLR